MKIKKFIMTFLALIIVLGLNAETLVYADTDGANINSGGFTVTMDKNGQTTVGGTDVKNAGSGQSSFWNKVFNEYGGIIMGVTGVGTLTMIILFIFAFIKLGASGENPQARSQSLKNILWTGIAAAGLGATTIFVAFSSNLLH